MREGEDESVDDLKGLTVGRRICRPPAPGEEECECDCEGDWEGRSCIRIKYCPVSERPKIDKEIKMELMCGATMCGERGVGI